MSLFDGQPLDTQEKIEAHAARMREKYEETMAKVEAIKKGIFFSFFSGWKSLADLL